MSDTFRIIERPVGPQPIPEWVKDCEVDWSDGYSNPPSFVLKVTDAHDWPDQRWKYDKGLFYTEHADGRGKFLSHHGKVSPTTMRRRKEGVSLKDDDCKLRTTEELWEDYQGLATSKQDGFAGRGFEIVMADDSPWPGETVVLRGPWYGARLGGYQDVTTYAPNEQDKWWAKQRRPWWKRGGTFGLFVHEDVLINIACRFLPHLELAAVEGQYEPRIQPLKPEWDAPKRWIYERERQKRMAA